MLLQTIEAITNVATIRFVQRSIRLTLSRVHLLNMAPDGKIAIATVIITAVKISYCTPSQHEHEVDITIGIISISFP